MLEIFIFFMTLINLIIIRNLFHLGLTLAYTRDQDHDMFIPIIDGILNDLDIDHWFFICVMQMSSDGPTHNEFDFEFLGNSSGEPYSVQTNVYVNGVGNREQRLNLWFDPTKDFHTYSLFWNQRQVV